MNAICVDNDGICTPVTIRQTKATITCNRKRLHIHHICKDPAIAILTAYDPQALQCSSVAPFTFPIPPPLNAFVYPSPIYATMVDADGVLSALDVPTFVSICEELGVLALKTESEAVYDVPATPFADDIIDETLDDASDDDHINDFEDDPETDEAEQDEEDDDWDVDDEDATSTI